MKPYLLFIISLLSISTYAQDQPLATNSFVVTGKVKNETTISITDIRKYPATELTDINTSCSPKKEEKSRQVKVVLLKTLLDSVKFDYDKPKSLGQFYFLFISSDGYKLVFSFNEIYNTEVGNNLYIVTEIDNKKIEEMDGRIMMLSTKDIKGGSRNLKGLAKIIVCKAD